MNWFTHLTWSQAGLLLCVFYLTVTILWVVWAVTTADRKARLGNPHHTVRRNRPAAPGQFY